MNFKKKRIVENKKDVKTQKDVLDNMDLETRKADIDKDIEDHKKNVDNFKDVIKQCSLVEGYNYTNDKNNYTVNVKSRAELAKLVESLKQNNIKHRISRSKIEGYKYDVNFKYTLNEGLTYKYEVHAVDDKDEDKVYKVFTDEQKAVKYAKGNAIKCFIDKVTYSDDEQTDSDTIYGPTDLEEDVEKTEVKKVTTPRGTFEVVDKTEDELRKDGYGYHHSGNGYKIFVKNNQAVAIKECNLKEDVTNQTTRKVSKQKGNNTPITDEDQKKEWEAEDENNWNESLDKNNLKQEILDACKKFYTEVLEWEDEDVDDTMKETDVEVQDYKDMSNKECIRVVLGNGYLTRKGLGKLCKYVEDNVLANYDKNAYFEGEDISSYSAIIRSNEKDLKESTLSNSRLKKGDKVKLNPEWNKRIEDQSLLDDEYEVVGFWNNEKVIDTDDAPDEFIDLSGIRIKNTRTGKEYSVNRYQLNGIEESLKEKLNDNQKSDFYNNLYTAISNICYNLYKKDGVHIDEEEFDETINRFKKHFFDTDDMDESLKLTKIGIEKEEDIEECNLTEDITYKDVQDFIDKYLMELCKKYNVTMNNGWIDGNSYKYIVKDKDTKEVLFYTDSLAEIDDVLRVRRIKQTNENLTEKKTRKQPKWRYNGNPEASAQFIANGTNLAGQPCCEAFSLLGDYDEEEQNWGYELCIDGNCVESNDGYESEISALTDAVSAIENYQFDIDYTGDTSKEQFLISTTLDGATRNDWHFDEVKKYLGIEESLKETKEDEVVEDDVEEISLDDINIDDIDVDNLDSISVDDIVDENITALDILKDKLNIEVEDNKVTISEKDVDDEDAPQIEVEVEEEEAETLKNELTDEEPIDDESEEEAETEEPKKDGEAEAVIVAIDGDVEIPEPDETTETDGEINFNNLGDEEPVDDGELTDEVKEDWKHLGSDMQFVEKKQNKKDVNESSESNDNSNNSNNNDEDDELVDYEDTDDAAPNM